MSERTILFVCLHGAAKSVIAASHCQRLADEAGLAVRATFAGTEPDPEMAPAAAAGLRAEGIDIGGCRPRRVTPDEIREAWRVVSFGCDLDGLAPGVRPERWDDVPAVGAGYRAVRDAIVARLPGLLAGGAGSPPGGGPEPGRATGAGRPS
jgi:protein-tyrosine-phosphatase